MKKLFVELCHFWSGTKMMLADAYDGLLDLWFEIKPWSEKVKRIIWNKGIKLRWNRLWVRKNEFHSSLNMDANAMLSMSQKQRSAYTNDLYRRRQIAHERDLISV